MPNTNSAKKAVRSSLKKRAHNQFWKNRVKSALKALKKTVVDKVTNSDVVAEQLVALQKSVDKATKEKVIHKNKANRLKSKYARKTAKLVEKTATKSKSTKKA
jgi:small subunit ribosomal protein S20